MNARRLVWLDDDLCGCIYTALAQAYPSSIEKADEFHRAWKTAPSDPAGDVEVAIFVYDHGEIRRAWTAQEREEYAARANLVLRALGVPDGADDDGEAKERAYKGWMP